MPWPSDSCQCGKKDWPVGGIEPWQVDWEPTTLAVQLPDVLQPDRGTNRCAFSFL